MTLQQLSDLKPDSFARVVVLGCSGSGKSALAAKLAAQLDIPYVATDAVYWRPGWVPASSADVRSWIANAAAQPRWAMDGNFDEHQNILWRQADLAVWLDLPLALTVWRALRRNMTWWIKGTLIWGGLRMTLPHALRGVRRVLKSHPQKRATYPTLLQGFPNLTVIRIRSTRELES